jgi:hypothetical protein
MFDGVILSRTRPSSYLGGIGDGLAVAFIVLAILATLSAYVSHKIFDPLDFAYITVVLPVFAILALRKGRAWKKQGGPVLQLAPKAFGVATAYFVFWLALIVAVALKLLHIIRF